MSILPRARQGHTSRIWDYPFLLPLVVVFDREGTIYPPHSSVCQYRGPLVRLVWRGGVYNQPNTLRKATISVRCPHLPWSFTSAHGYARWAMLCYRASDRFYRRLMTNPAWRKRVRSAT